MNENIPLLLVEKSKVYNQTYFEHTYQLELEELDELELEVLEVAGAPMQHGNAAIVAPSMLVAVHRSMWFPAMPQM